MNKQSNCENVYYGHVECPFGAIGNHQARDELLDLISYTCTCIYIYIYIKGLDDDEAAGRTEDDDEDDGTRRVGRTENGRPRRVI